MGEMLDRILAGLNEAQREAVLTARGPLVILAGAGTGKTTTVTRRIAAQVATEVFEARQLLALTFSAKAAGELRERLGHLGVDGVRAVTFHAEALAQFRRFVDKNLEILPSKAQVLHGFAKRLPRPFVFTPLRELATEIEWAKNRRIGAKTYLERIEGHEPPIPAELMHRLFIDYEREKRRRGTLDFEDLLERVLVHLSEHDRDLGVVRSRYSAFTVDEYQDVNLLQQSLLEVWLGVRDEVCVVGDDHQAIYGFTGATPSYLQSFGDRYANARIVTLRENHRSSPQVIEVANRLSAHITSRKRALRATKADGSPVAMVAYETSADEVRAVVTAIQAEVAAGTEPAEIAVLVRINARTEPYEEALAAAGIGYQVRGGAFLARPAARSFLARVRRLDPETPTIEAVATITDALGMTEDTENLPDEERTRQEDLRRLRQLAAPAAAVGIKAFVEDLTARFSSDQDAEGVQLMSLHRSKGLEFEVVFLPEVEEATLPITHANSDEDIAEERRLLYVGVTRAKGRLHISRAANRPGSRPAKPKPSRFWKEFRPQRLERIRGARRIEHPEPVVPRTDPTFVALRTWRTDRAKTQGVPAYLVFADATLAEIAQKRPASREALRAISGVGPMKLARYGEELLAVLGSLEEAG